MPIDSNGFAIRVAGRQASTAAAGNGSLLRIPIAQRKHRPSVARPKRSRRQASSDGFVRETEVMPGHRYKYAFFAIILV